MAEEIFLQHWIFTRFALPFLLVFAIVFAVLEKTKVLGDGKKQLNALVAFIVGLIFVSVVYPQLVVTNLILFLSVAIVVVFVVWLLWGFISGGEAKLPESNVLKIVLGVVLGVAVVIAVLWATGVHTNVANFFTSQNWTSGFWLNALFVILIAAALALVLKGAKSGKKE